MHLLEVEGGCSRMTELSSTARDLPLPPAGTHGGGAFGGIDAKVVKVSSMHAVLPAAARRQLSRRSRSRLRARQPAAAEGTSACSHPLKEEQAAVV